MITHQLIGHAVAQAAAMGVHPAIVREKVLNWVASKNQVPMPVAVRQYNMGLRSALRRPVLPN